MKNFPAPPPLLSQEDLRQAAANWSEGIRNTSKRKVGGLLLASMSFLSIVVWIPLEWMLMSHLLNAYLPENAGLAESVAMLLAHPIAMMAPALLLHVKGLDWIDQVEQWWWKKRHQAHVATQQTNIEQAVIHHQWHNEELKNIWDDPKQLAVLSAHELEALGEEMRRAPPAAFAIWQQWLDSDQPLRVAQQKYVQAYAASEREYIQQQSVLNAPGVAQQAQKERFRIHSAPNTHAPQEEEALRLLSENPDACQSGVVPGHQSHKKVML